MGRWWTGIAEALPEEPVTVLAVAPASLPWYTSGRGATVANDDQGRHWEGRMVPSGCVGALTVDAVGSGRLWAVDAANNVWYTDLSGWVGRLAAARAQGR